MRFNFKQTRLSAVSQIILGSLCVIFGTCDRIFMYRKYDGVFHTKGVMAIWMGAWFLLTGVIGYFGGQPQQNTQRPQKGVIGTYLGFSIVATVFAGVLIICFSVGIVIITKGRPCRTRYDYKCDYGYPYNNCYYKEVPDSKMKCQRSVGLGAMIIIFAIIEFGVSIWASVCCCNGFDGCCCNQSPPQTQGQVVYIQTQGGQAAAYVITQGPNGMPVAVPAMTGVPVNPVPNQAVGGQQHMMQQNPQIGPPTQYVQQGAYTTSADQQPGGKSGYGQSERPPAYTP